MARRPETYSADQPLRELPAIEDPAERADEIVVAQENELTAGGYADQLAFNEEFVTVILYKGREKYAPKYHDFTVNGQGIRVQVDQPTRIKRKFVEVIARAQPMDVRTEVEDEQGEAPINRIVRSLSSSYPFAVVEDANPKGAAWLAKIMREG